MNFDFIERWANVLPNFAQGREALRSATDEYCCLGVACELYKQETGLGEWEEDGVSYLFITEHDSSDVFLPYDVAQFIFGNANMVTGDMNEWDDPFHVGDESFSTFTHANDILGLDFAQIKEALLTFVSERRTSES